jgi:prepilin-type N-terminal cleavage/methylation domain-containing protein
MRPVRVEKKEHGFTLPEVLIVIVILGILLAIAVPTWFGVVESRQVDSAANQFASDLRLAHNKATNRLEPQKVVLTSGGSSYKIGTSDSFETRDFCGDDGCSDNDPQVSIAGVDEGDEVTITFSPDGSASVEPDGAPTTFKVATDGNSGHDIQLTPATSGVEVDP